MASVRNLLSALRIAKYIPLIIALVTKFRTLLKITDDLLDRIEEAASGKRDLVIKSGSQDAIQLNHTFRRLHELTNKLDGEL